MTLGTGHKVEGGGGLLKFGGGSLVFNTLKRVGQGKKCTALRVGRVKLFTYHHKRLIVESVF